MASKVGGAGIMNWVLTKKIYVYTVLQPPAPFVMKTPSSRSKLLEALGKATFLGYRSDVALNEGILNIVRKPITAAFKSEPQNLLLHL